ncbi:MAG: thiamine diphosphokinase [Trueperaceae bacterium]
MKAVILAGGRLAPSPHLEELLAGHSLVLAADSGLRHALALGLEPAAIVGDFDSVAEADLASFPELPQLRHPVRKDQLDLELAIDLAMERGADELLVLGAFGSRLDQSLAALLIGARLRTQGIAISLHDGVRDAYPLTAGDTLDLALPPGMTFSLLALEQSRCTVAGADYPLSDAPLPFGVGLGLANRAMDGPRIAVHEGAVAVIVERTVMEP